MAKYLQCSECGKLAFYYADFVGTEKPFYRRFMRYPEGETKLEPPRCFSCDSKPLRPTPSRWTSIPSPIGATRPGSISTIQDSAINAVHEIRKPANTQWPRCERWKS